MTRPLGAVAALLLATACGGGDPAAAPRPELSVSLAWVGEHESGLKVVAERIHAGDAPEEAAFSEEEMLRERLRIGSDVELMRLHLVGEPSQLDEPGRLQLGAGTYAPLGDPPAGLGSRARTLWIGVADGGTAPGSGPFARRSFLLAGKGEVRNSSAALRWEREDATLPLAARTWTRRERSDYLRPPEVGPLDD